MTQEEKQILLQDLCARLPFGVKAKITEEGVLSYDIGIGVIVGKEYVYNETFILQCKNDSYFLTAISEFVPYLRPLSSITKKEMEELRELCGGIVWTKDILHDEVLNIYYRHDALDWLLKHHFDTRGLIEMGLALEAPEGMYNIMEGTFKEYADWMRNIGCATCIYVERLFSLWETRDKSKKFKFEFKCNHKNRIVTADDGQIGRRCRGFIE